MAAGGLTDCRHSLRGARIHWRDACTHTHPDPPAPVRVSQNNTCIYLTQLIVQLDWALLRTLGEVIKDEKELLECSRILGH